MDALDPLLREAAAVVVIVCFPILGVATLCGLLTAIVQAATQIQEQTLTLLPKMLAVGAMIAFFGSFAMHACAGLLRDAINAVSPIVLRS